MAGCVHLSSWDSSCMIYTVQPDRGILTLIPPVPISSCQYRANSSYDEERSFVIVLTAVGSVVLLAPVSDGYFSIAIDKHTTRHNAHRCVVNPNARPYQARDAPVSAAFGGPQ